MQPPRARLVALAACAAACAPRGALALAPLARSHKAAATAAQASAPVVPSIALRNAAAAGQTMPYIGLGTGGYGSTPNSYGAYPVGAVKGACPSGQIIRNRVTPAHLWNHRRRRRSRPPRAPK